MLVFEQATPAENLRQVSQEGSHSRKKFHTKNIFLSISFSFDLRCIFYWYQLKSWLHITQCYFYRENLPKANHKKTLAFLDRLIIKIVFSKCFYISADICKNLGSKIIWKYLGIQQVLLVLFQISTHFIIWIVSNKQKNSIIFFNYII